MTLGDEFRDRTRRTNGQKQGTLVREDTLRRLQKELGVSLAHIPHNGLFDFSGHCENAIGTIQVPVGIAGPLPVCGEILKRSVYLPLATTEAALVASTNRGCKAIREAGGALVRAEKIGMSRAPCFVAPDLKEALAFAKWVERQKARFQQSADKVSSHARIREIRAFVYGRNVYVRFVFDTDDAMGMNIATLATQRIIEDHILPRTCVRLSALSGNVCTDKKPALINRMEGRGFRVQAEVKLPERVIREVLKTTSRDLLDTHWRKNLLGSAVAGSLGHNSHHANILTALFLSTGQDLAHIAEIGMGFTHVEKEEDGLVCGVTLPDLPVGAVGGGTSLPWQREAQRILGVGTQRKRGARAHALAEAMGAGVLAGEVSLLAAIAAHHLASAHDKLRKRSRL